MTVRIESSLDPPRHEGHRRHEDHGPLAAHHPHDVTGHEDGGDAAFIRRDISTKSKLLLAKNNLQGDLSVLSLISDIPPSCSASR